MTTLMTKRRFSVKEFIKMAEAGILYEDDRLELLDGEIIQMAAIGSYHAACVDTLNERFVLATQGIAIVRPQNPLKMSDDTLLEPDMVIARPHENRYRETYPTPEDTLLIIEVSDSTINYDANVKIPRYASGGAPEVWQVNLQHDLIDSHSDPDTASGRYRNVRRFLRGQTITPTMLPNATLNVSDILISQV